MRVLLLFVLCVLGGCAAPLNSWSSDARVAFDSRRIIGTSAHGFADHSTKRRLTVDDPVRVASVSKLVVALGVMRLVEAGMLDLDKDVSATLGWPVRNPSFPDTPVTLRALLSHTASLRDGVDYTIPYGGTLKQVLADPKAWDSGHPPGGYFTYANIGFPVIAAIMEKATGERFDALMARLVFAPLKLDACFNWVTCSDAKVSRHVVLYSDKGAVRRDDLHGRRPGCPVFTAGGCDLSTYRLGDNGALFSPQGGMRISAHDLARIGQMLLNNGSGFLTPASIRMMSTATWSYDGANGDTEGGFYCSYGLAVQRLSVVRGCNDDIFGDRRARSGHAGEAYGLRSGLWIDPDRRTGVAYFVTAVPDDAQPGHTAYTLAEERLARKRR